MFFRCVWKRANHTISLSRKDMPTWLNLVLCLMFGMPLVWSVLRYCHRFGCPYLLLYLALELLFYLVSSRECYQSQLSHLHVITGLICFLANERFALSFHFWCKERHVEDRIFDWHVRSFVIKVDQLIYTLYTRHALP